MTKSHRTVLYGYVIPLVVSVFFIVLLGASIIGTWYLSKGHAAKIITEDITKLATIFNKIDKTCGIVDFEYQQNPINFLNVKSFVGSEVGPMNLKHPEKWEGPYLKDNPTLQEKEYMVIRTKQGYFITPGNGVKLPNRKRIGKNIMLTEHADMQAMVQDPTALMHDGVVFAIKILNKN